MMKKKSMMILLVILAVLVALCLIVTLSNKHEEKIKQTSGVILSFDTDDVTELSWTVSGNTFSFEKVDGEWVKTGDSEFPVNQDKIENLLLEISAYEARFIIEDATNLADYGLKNPECSITVITDSESHCLLLGGYSSMDEERYFSVGDGNAYLAAVDVLADFDVDDTDLIKLDSVPTMSEIKSFTISGDNTLELIYLEDAGYCYSDKYTYYIKDGSGYKAVGTDEAESLIDQIRYASLDSYEAYSQSSDLSKYGLDNPDLSVAVNYLDGESRDCTFNISMSNVNDTVYAKLEDSPIVYKLALASYESIRDAGYDSLCSTQLVYVDWDDVASIDAVVDSRSYNIDLQGDLDDELKSALETALDALDLNSYTSAAPEKGLEISVTINMIDGDNLKLKFYKHNADDCLVLVDGTSTGYVSRSLVVNLTEAINAIILN